MISALKKKKHIRSKFLVSLISLLFLGGMASCESIYDKDEDCDPYFYIRFVYDLNMDYADAFPAKVNSVDLYVFDANTGEYVDKFSEYTSVLSQEGYKMRLYLKPGNYRFIAWCGLNNNEGHFTVPSAVSNYSSLGCTMARNRNNAEKAVQNVNLHSLFHGQLVAELPDKPGDHIYTVYLTKDTNNINFSLQDTSGNELDPERFTIALNINNGGMASDNTVLDDEEIEYQPYWQGSGSAVVGSTRDDAADQVRHDIVTAELSTARLISTHNPTLDIYDNEKGEMLFQVPLVKWALMLKSQQYKQMGDQEYLDREDEFNIMLYITEDEVKEYYLAVSVLINGWHMVLKDSELQ